MSWQDDCRAKGGAVTVLPKGVLDGDPYIPCCRLSNGDGTSNYVDMRSIEETVEDNLGIWEDNWNILLGKGVQVRDDIVDTTKKVFEWSFATVAIAAAVGLSLFAYLEKKK